MNARALGSVINGVGAVSPTAGDRATYALFRNLTPKAKVADREREVHRHARPTWIDVAGKQVATYQWGDDSRRPVLLVHGWHSRASRFAAFIQPLIDHGFNPVSFDAPANGDSEGRTTTILEYEAAIHQLGAKYGPFQGVVAHSFGALATFHSMRKSAGIPKIVTIAGVSNFEHLYAAFCAGLGLDSRVGQGLRNKVGNELFPSIPDIWHHFDAARDVHEIPGDVLAIHSADDPRVPVAHAHRIVSAFSGRSEEAIVNGLGHHRVLNDHSVVGRALDFLT